MIELEKARASLDYVTEQAIPLRKSWRLSARVMSAPEKRPMARSKRAFDAAVAFLGILVSSPLWLFFALAIFVEDGLPVFYRQSRVGQSGRIFNALKFRTMRKDAEAGIGPVQAGKNDPRVTRVGAILRKTALDELPQLWNILKGDMSFVGPRPLRPGEILADQSGERVRLEDVPGFDERITITPGLTGLAQVYAPRNIHHRQKFRYDLLYIKKQNFFLDLKLIYLSFLRTFRGRWEA